MRKRLFPPQGPSPWAPSPKVKTLLENSVVSTVVMKQGRFAQSVNWAWETGNSQPGAADIPSPHRQSNYFFSKLESRVTSERQTWDTSWTYNLGEAGVVCGETTSSAEVGPLVPCSTHQRSSSQHACSASREPTFSLLECMVHTYISDANDIFSVFSLR